MILKILMNKIKRLGPGVRDERGLSLIEVLLAVSILSFGTISVLRGYARALDVLSVAQQNIDMVSLVKEKMEDLEEEALLKHGIALASTAGSFAGYYSDYQWAVESEPLAGGKLNKITLNISREGSSRTMTTETYFQTPQQK